VLHPYFHHGPKAAVDELTGPQSALLEKSAELSQRNRNANS
jgi:hypothetical protein